MKFCTHDLIWGLWCGLGFLFKSSKVTVNVAQATLTDLASSYFINIYLQSVDGTTVCCCLSYLLTICPDLSWLAQFTITNTNTTFGFCVTISLPEIYLNYLSSRNTPGYNRSISESPSLKNLWGFLVQDSYKPDAFNVAQPTELKQWMEFNYILSY